MRAWGPAMRTALLRFVSGQERTPPTDAEWRAAGLRMLIKAGPQPGQPRPPSAAERRAARERERQQQRQQLQQQRAPPPVAATGGGGGGIDYHALLDELGLGAMRRGASGGEGLVRRTSGGTGAEPGPPAPPAATGAAPSAAAPPPSVFSASDVDALLPSSDTCFFNLTLPGYSGAAVLRARFEAALSLDAAGLDGDM